MKKWKFSWGTGIVVALSLFALSMSYAMYLAVNERVDLVATDYYEAELAYQQKIERKKNAQKLAEPCRLKYSDEGLWLHFPEELQGRKGELRLLMYHQNDGRRDFKISESDWAITDFEIPASRLATGRWIAKLELDTEGGDYYFEPAIVLP